jgi:hypothetical protein
MQRLLLLHDLLASFKPTPAGDLERDALLSDLANRIKRLSIRTEFEFGGRIPLVAGYANKAVAILPDSAIDISDVGYGLRSEASTLSCHGLAGFAS